MTEQLTLHGLKLPHHASFASFFPGQNQVLVDYLQAFVKEKNEQFIYLWGASGSGRSHLLQACCDDAFHLGYTSMTIALEDLLPTDALVFEAMESLDLVCLDDLQVIAGKPIWEEAIFHLFNRLRETGRQLIVTADKPPREINIQLADLKSRLQWGVCFHLHFLTDEEKMLALQTVAHSRGFELAENVAVFLLSHCSRNPRDLFAVLDKLDNASLAAGRRLTVPFVKQVLGL